MFLLTMCAFIVSMDAVRYIAWECVTVSAAAYYRIELLDYYKSERALSRNSRVIGKNYF